MKRLSSIFLLVLLALLAMPLNAAAAPWQVRASSCGGGNPADPKDNAERGSGQLDAAGRLYLACSRSARADGTEYWDHNVAIYDQAGAKVGRIPLDFDRTGNNYRASDVAPSPDGSIVYVVRYSNFTVYRFDRQHDGSYMARSQAEWSLGYFPDHGGAAATNKPRGQFISTDADGNIYLSAGLWTCGEGSAECTDNAVVKYRPDGSLVTRFGRKVQNSWALGDSHGSFGGLTVTADGRRVFVADINNSRVQRFDRAGDGSYVAAKHIGHNTQQTDPNRQGGCFGADDRGWLAAPYDVALSPRGELIVINTSCFLGDATIEVRRFDQDGTSRGSATAKSRDWDKVHGLAVDRAGNIHLPQARMLLAPPAGYSDAGADLGGGGPLGGTAAAVVVDATAPTVTRLDAPATITAPARDVTLTISATDDTAVREIRISEDGVPSAWRAVAATVTWTLTDRVGAHVISVEARDAAGNVSAARSVTVQRDAAPVVVTPTPTPTPTPKPDPVVVTPAPVTPAPIVDGGGGGTADVTRPTVLSVKLPVQVFRGRSIVPRIGATDNVAATQVRFATESGVWGPWRSINSPGKLLLPFGAGWHGVFTQVRDAAGNRSSTWFQPVLVGPRGTAWYKGTAGADKPRLGRGAQHADLTRFDAKVDRISCGAGFDTVLVQREDIVSRDCERVIRLRVPPA